MSTVAIFGAVAFYDVSQDQADTTMEKVIAAGINHIDVAPSYGQAEMRLGPWMQRSRERFFLGSKTMERDRTGADTELRSSLEALRINEFDLYQIHAVEKIEDLDAATAHGGALEAIIEAQKTGLTRFIGITSHGNLAPVILLEALKRFDFDSVLFPINSIQYSDNSYRQNTETLLKECRKKNVGTMVIKTVAKGTWEEKKKTHTTWYEPFSDPDTIKRAVNFVLSQEVTGLCTPGDIHLLPDVIYACENYSRLSAIQQEDMIVASAQYRLLWS
jgi:predicted aldo/keto reductase-like oxidoreductase